MAEINIDILSANASENVHKTHYGHNSQVLPNGTHASGDYCIRKRNPKKHGKVVA